MAEFWLVGGFFCLVREIDFTGMSAFCFLPLDFMVFVILWFWLLAVLLDI